MSGAGRDWLERRTGFLDPYRRRQKPLDSEPRRFFAAISATLGNPHSAVPAIHISGSKGKGTTAYYAAKLLAASGLRVGLSMSPHLVSDRERALLDFRMSSERDIEGALSSIASVDVDIPGRPTYSGAMSLAAMLIFARSDAKAAVIECGLGGENDATGFLGAPVCILTFVEQEHTAQLGNDLTGIALEKAGIAVRGSTLVCGSLPSPCSEAVERLCYARGVQLVAVDTLGMRPSSGCMRLADTAADLLLSRLSVPKGKVELADLVVPGRNDLRHIGDSRILFDGAHTVASIASLAEALAERFARRPTLIFGCTPPRDPMTLMRPLLEVVDRAYVVPMSGEIQEDPRVPVLSPEQAIELLQQAGDYVVTGSFHLVGQAMSSLGIRPFEDSAKSL